jgi:hypothetical protein
VFLSDAFTFLGDLLDENRIALAVALAALAALAFSFTFALTVIATVAAPAAFSFAFTTTGSTGNQFTTTLILDSQIITTAAAGGGGSSKSKICVPTGCGQMTVITGLTGDTVTFRTCTFGSHLINFL